MTAATRRAAWRQPQWPVWPEHKQDRLRGYAVQCLLRLGSEEYAESDWALGCLRALRPDLTVQQIAERVDRLLDLADEVADAEQSGRYERFVCAQGEYEDALAELAGESR